MATTSITTTSATIIAREEENDDVLMITVDTGMADGTGGGGGCGGDGGKEEVCIPQLQMKRYMGSFISFGWMIWHRTILSSPNPLYPINDKHHIGRWKKRMIGDTKRISDGYNPSSPTKHPYPNNSNPWRGCGTRTMCIICCPNPSGFP